MPYITMKQSPAYRNISFEDILSGKYADAPIIISNNESNTRTYFVEKINPKFLKKFDIDEMINILNAFCERHKSLMEVDRASLYSSFLIPKRTRGYRRIDAPNDELKFALYELKQIFEDKMFALYHTSAFAYIRNRSTIDAVKRHQANESRWFLKTDFSDFFGSTTHDFLIRMLSMIFPFSEIVKEDRGREALEKALEFCLLNGGLPQGTPISPMLTNLMMIPIDHRLSNTLRDFNKNSFVYTRYADDSTISCKYNFMYKDVIKLINDTLSEFDAPFKIKAEKTKYGSNSGSNWILGVILNKDNDITIGNKNKKRLRALITNYILDKKSGNQWDLNDVEVFEGHLNYYRMIEPTYIDEVIRYTNEKYDIDLINMIRKDKSVV